MAVRVTAHGKLELNFGPHRIQDEQVFYWGNHALGIVNMMESCTGHVLVLPKRPAASLDDLGDDEAADFMLAIQRTAKVLEDRYESGQDGIQVVIVDQSSTVPHLHAHVVPRLSDDILSAIERTESILDRPPERQLASVSCAPRDISQPAPVSDVQREADILVKIANRAALRQESPTNKKQWPRPMPSLNSNTLDSNQSLDTASNFEAIPFGPRTFGADQCCVRTRSTVGFINPTPTVPGHLLLMPKRSELPRLKQLTESECRDLGVGLKESAARLGKLHRNAQGVVAVLVDRDQPCDMFGNMQEPIIVPQVHWSIVPRINPDPFPAIRMLDQNYLMLAMGAPSRSFKEMAAEAFSVRDAFNPMVSRHKPPRRALSPPSSSSSQLSRPKQPQFPMGYAQEEAQFHAAMASVAPRGIVPGSQRSDFKTKQSLAPNGLRILTEYAPAYTSAGSPVREKMQPKRPLTADGKPRWDSSGRTDMWFGERSQYRKKETEEGQSKEDAAYAKLFMKTMDKIRKAAYSSHKQKAGGQRDANIDLERVFREIDLDGNGVLDQEELGLACESFGIRLTPKELDAVFSFFDRDGEGVEYGEFSWVFFNRRVLEKAGSGWGGAAKNSGGGSTAQGLSEVRASLNAMRAQKKPQSPEAAAGTLKERVAARELSASAALDIIKGVLDKISQVFGEGSNIDLKAAFAEFDEDGGGTIDEAELKSALTNMGIELSDMEIDLVMKHFDKDGGGIEYGEFAWTYYNRRTLGKAGGGGAQNRKAVAKLVKSASSMVDRGDDEDEDEDPLERVKYMSHSDTVGTAPGSELFKMAMDQIHAEATKPNQQKTGSLHSAFQTESFDHKLKNVFKKYDSSGDGLLDESEIKALLVEMGVELGEEELSAVYKFLDRDGKGVEYGEFQWAYNNRNDLAQGKQRWCGNTKDTITPAQRSEVMHKEKRITPLIEMDPTYVVRVSKPKHVRTYDNSPMGTFECAMDKIRDKATDPSGRKLNLKKIFEEFDEDGGGTIDKDELYNALTRMGVSLLPIEFETVYSFFDRDGGGIEYGEFCWCFYNRRVLASGNSSWCDPSGSGEVVQKKEKPRVGDARFRYWYEKDMNELAVKRKKAERVERERQQLRLQAQSQMQHRLATGHHPAMHVPSSKRAWIPAGRAIYEDKWLTTLD